MSDMKVKQNDKTITVSCRVKNTGSRPSKQVVQLYSTQLNPTTDRPAVELRGYKKTHTLQCGEECEVEITIPTFALAVYSEKDTAWVLERGDYRLRLGFDSMELPLEEQITIKKEVKQAVTGVLAPAEGELFIK